MNGPQQNGPVYSPLQAFLWFCSAFSQFSSSWVLFSSWFFASNSALYPHGF